MPFIRGDAEMFDEILSEVDPDDLPEGFADKRPGDEFEYEKAEATFTSKKLERVAKFVHQTLLDMGATEFRVRYDGGYDEGFAYPEYVVIGKEKRPVAKLVADFKKLIPQIRAESKKGRSDYLKDIVDKQVSEYAIDQLAHELASLLLGEGYGTGEYELYGAFTADLKSGKITDDPKAKKKKGK